MLPYDLKKPKKFENKKLGAEKSSEKKFGGGRRFIQNTVTHYNWYFNANNKINEIVDRAKFNNKDDYTQLLPFYNYSLEKTATDKTELDSVIYKTNAGILTHDLRNAWIDNLYMLMGKAYFFRNDLDSAYKTFQYINYAFSPKDDGYDLPIGSNSNEGGNAFSISTREKSNVVQRIVGLPPSRNESFIWQVRTYIEKGAMPQAASMIQTLKNDPVFPERLHTDLNEVQAYWFYKQNVYDSAAFYLERSLDNASNKAETSRWEYLIAQLYELSKDPARAQEFYERAIRHTLDPVLEVYARLNAIRQNTSDSLSIKKNIEELRKMARRDKYTKYRDIVYYTAAQIELQRNNVPGAKEMLLKATAASTETLNPAQRTKSFLLLGDLCFEEKQYVDAKRFYDSVNNNDAGIADIPLFEKRKETLTKIVLQTDIMHRQDSLQRIAAMKPADREALLKKMARQLRKKQGLKEDETTPGNLAVGMNEANTPVADLFADNSNKGDWYFANPSLKSKGLSLFKQTWGNRPNVDNWRRLADVNDAGSTAKDSRGSIPGNTKGHDSTATDNSGAISYKSLLKNIPLTEEQIDRSKDSVENAMIDLGIIYINNLEEYPAAIDTLERFSDQFPYSSRKPEALYYLYYAYKKMGNEAKAGAVQHELDQKYSGTRYQQQVHNAVTGDGDREKKNITRAYETVYNLFIEGNFPEALHQKKLNDSLYGSGYWTPQLLYIQSVYFLHTRQDDEAKKVLNSIIDLYPENPMSTKARNILEVLGRRKEIEDYLTKLQIKRVEDSVIVENPKQLVTAKVGTPMKQDSLTLRPIKMSLADSLAKLKKPVTLAAKSDSIKVAPSAYTFNTELPHSVAIVLIKVDPVYVSESRNAFNRYNQQTFYNKTITINNLPLNDTAKLVVISGFANAADARDYMEKTQAVAATQIIPWMPAGKYSFILIGDQNIEVLKNRQDLNEYRKFQERYFPKK